MWKYLIVFILLSISYVESQKNFKNLLQKHRDEFSVLETDEIKPLATEATYRLPNDTEPILYNVILDFGKFHEGDMYFAGSVLIVIRIVKFTNTITLHNAAHITRTTLLKENITISHSYEFDTEREFIIVKSDEILVPEQVVLLTIFFIGSIGTSFRGVYRGSYLNDASEKRFDKPVVFNLEHTATTIISYLDILLLRTCNQLLLGGFFPVMTNRHLKQISESQLFTIQSLKCYRTPYQRFLQSNFFINLI